jgi:hypothetical protein
MQGLKVPILSYLFFIFSNAPAANDLIFQNSFELLAFGTVRFLTPEANQVFGQAQITVRIRI